jgi:thymidylate synthase ThyX
MLLQTLKTTLWRLHVYLVHVRIRKINQRAFLSYLVRHKHWSPFEHGHATFEIETSKAIGIQLIRHRSFSFQEFSQRYQDVNRLGSIFEPIELRAQCEDNRQSSTEVINPRINFGDYRSLLG